MAAFTSVVSGDWNASATWGNAGSPPVKGTDFPGAAGDTFTVSAEHTVTYNVSETNELGASTINGTLYFHRGMSTKLVFNHNNLSIGAGGTLDVSKTGDLVGAGYVAELYWNTTSDAVKGLVLNATGNIYLQDNPAYYGGTTASFLASTWSSGQTLTVLGDVTGWPVGGTILVHKCASTYGAIATDCLFYTIASRVANGSNTDIVINEAAPSLTFNSGGRVLLLSRNVRHGKSGFVRPACGTAVTNRPYHTTNQANTGTVKIGGECLGIYGFYGTRNFVFDSSFVCSSCAIFTRDNALNCEIKGIFVGLQNSIYTTLPSDLKSCNIIAAGCGGLFTTGANLSILTIEYFGGSNYSGIMNICTKDSYSYGNQIGFGSSLGQYDRHNNLKLGINPRGIVCANTQDIQCGAYMREAKSILTDVLCNTALTFRTRNTLGGGMRLGVEGYNQVPDTHLCFHEYADAIKNDVTVRSGGAVSSLEVVPLSLIGNVGECVINDWYEEDVPASSQTRKIYVLGEGWSSWPLATELYIEAEYYDSATLFTKAIAVSTVVLTDNVTWTEIPVTFVPAQVGLVRYRIWMKKYAASCKVYIDNALYNGSNKQEAGWKDGESSLDINYADWTPTGGSVGYVF